MKALVTGSAGGLGSVIVARLRAEGYEIDELDLTNGFDVTDPDAWDRVGPVDLAVLNAGVLTGEQDVSALTPEQYRRAVAVNVDGVVLGVRRLAAIMPEGSAIVATASLAGLVGIPDDPIYGLTKFAVVGFVRSAAPQLAARGIKLNALCPAWADTPLVPDDLRERIEARGWRLLEPEKVADGVLAAARSEGHGESWIVQVGREPLAFKYPGIPGPTLGGLGGTSLVGGVRWSPPRQGRRERPYADIWTRLRTPPRADQRGPTTQLDVSPSPPSRRAREAGRPPGRAAGPRSGGEVRSRDRWSRRGRAARRSRRWRRAPW